MERFPSPQDSYPGGKAGAGVYQKLINLMPQHSTYIEPFLGHGAVLLRKRPARLNIGVDLYDQAVQKVRSRLPVAIARITPAAAQMFLTMAPEDTAVLTR